MTLVRSIVVGIDKLSEWTGRVISWLTLGMVAVMFAVVILRYVFDMGWIAMQETVTYLHALVFMLGASYTLKHDEHVRVDVFYQNWSLAQRARVNLAGTLLLLLPLTGMILWLSLDYAVEAWRVREGSRQSGGLPYTYLLKTVIPVTAALLFIQGIAEALRSTMQLTAGTVHEAPHHGEKL